MRKIGFETTAYRQENYLPVVTQQEAVAQAYDTHYTNVEDILHERGLLQALQVVQDYFYNTTHRFVGDTDQDCEAKRSEACFEKLRKIKMRYFEPI
ncbi:hypothetical protein [Capnocytophaga canis]|uniref:hypothetical protein n=1 Tax=Capnocytophaga canis TaxID=1848903 RepID=UPI0037D57106